MLCRDGFCWLLYCSGYLLPGLSLESTPTRFCSSTFFFSNHRWVSPCPHPDRTFCLWASYNSINSLISPFSSRRDCTPLNGLEGSPKSSAHLQTPFKGEYFCIWLNCSLSFPWEGNYLQVLRLPHGHTLPATFLYW